MFWVCPTGEVIDKEIVESGNGLKGSIELKSCVISFCVDGLVSFKYFRCMEVYN